MNMSEQQQLSANGLRGELRSDEPMARHVSWRAGGPVRCAYTPADLDDMALFLRGLPDGEQVHVVGLGSNLLVRDGLDGTVIFAPGLGRPAGSAQRQQRRRNPSAGRRRKPEGGAIRRDARSRGRRIPRRHTRLHRRRAGDERRLLRQRDLGDRGARRDHRPPARYIARRSTTPSVIAASNRAPIRCPA
jgi:hypothetical protein